jgi:hypothetical protein
MAFDDPRCPEGMNYLDWLMRMLAPNEMTSENINEIAAVIKRTRMRGLALKKDQSPPADLLEGPEPAPINKGPRLVRRLV